jgi:predicted RNase H-like HicB family nuclease
MTKAYPIILTPDTDGYVVTVPDLEINTQGNDLDEAIFMARDAICAWGLCQQDAGRVIPEPSGTVPAHETNEIVSWIDIDFAEYRLANDERMWRYASAVK